MNRQDREYLQRAGEEVLASHVGKENALQFYLIKGGTLKHFDDDDGDFGRDPEGVTYLLDFGCYIRRDLGDGRAEFDPDYFAEYLMRKHSGLYVGRCGCSHDCCGHEFTANMDIHSHQYETNWWDENNERHESTTYRWTVIITNGVNL